ncbi:arsenate reductase ArsC [Temperatibacter marinus]|uniref:Arsenate reductase ArsC n=1 Tax=Temperatibacter marinus TaxID=1456591 RepID=A0AA52EEC9_9PROT|nr:arsenate reductase ArsC [Temperatibacter marinus]WND01533.1 arsenate reductase ArsC [Temperatibacter marinus]
MSINILVLCTGNSARSVLGEALLNKLGNGRISAYSAGSNPTGKVNPAALRLLDSKGFDTSEYRSKSWDEFTDTHAAKMDIVITVCGNAAGETCPIWPLKNGEQPVRIHMGFPDPADFGETDSIRDQAFAKVYEAQVKTFSAIIALPLESMPRETWAEALNAITVADVTL